MTNQTELERLQAAADEAWDAARAEAWGAAAATWIASRDALRAARAAANALAAERGEK